MKSVLVDSNVLLDVLTEDSSWFSWSSEQLMSLAESRALKINPIIYAEISVGFDRIELLNETLPSELLWSPLPREAAFLAGKAFVQYRRRGGTRLNVLPDFFIGAHAAVKNMILLTRDVARYKTYFPTLAVIHP
jgi:predicted nucleic acid-binding protein